MHSLNLFGFPTTAQLRKLFDCRWYTMPEFLFTPQANPVLPVFCKSVNHESKSLILGWRKYLFSSSCHFEGNNLCFREHWMRQGHEDCGWYQSSNSQFQSSLWNMVYYLTLDKLYYSGQLWKTLQLFWRQLDPVWIPLSKPISTWPTWLGILDPWMRSMQRYLSYKYNWITGSNLIIQW